MSLRFVVFLAVILFGNSFEICSQETNKKNDIPQPYSLVIKTNPLPLIWGPVPLTSELRFLNEFVVSPQQSSQIGFSYLSKSPLFSIFETGASNPNQPRIMVRGFRFQLWHKLYLNELLNMDKFAPEGFYIGPFFSYSTAKFTSKYLNIYDVYVRGTHVNINLVNGYQFIKGRFAMDFFYGFGYKENTWIEHTPPNVTPVQMDGLPGSYYSNLKLIIGFNAGLAF